MFDLLSSLALLSTSSRSFKAKNVDKCWQSMTKVNTTWEKGESNNKGFPTLKLWKVTRIGLQPRISGPVVKRADWKKMQVKKTQLLHSPSSEEFGGWCRGCIWRGLAPRQQNISPIGNAVFRIWSMQCGVMNCNFQFQIKWLEIIKWSFRSFMTLILVGQAVLGRNMRKI